MLNGYCRIDGILDVLFYLIALYSCTTQKTRLGEADMCGFLYIHWDSCKYGND